MVFQSLLSKSKSLLKPVTRKHIEHRILDTHPLHLFRIIQDVDKYKEFIPLCSYSKVIRRNPDGRSFDGTLVVGKPPVFSEQYTSRVTVIPEQLTINANSIESTNFDSLKSSWKLKEIGVDDIESGGDDDDDDDESDNKDNAGDFVSNHNKIRCDVNFEVEITVSDPIIIAMLDQVLQQVAGYQVSAFEQRCKELPLNHKLIEIANKYRNDNNNEQNHHHLKQ